MWDIFKRAADKQSSEAEQALKGWGIKYKKQSDGSLLVPGDLNISNRSLTKLPNLSSVKVGGHFYCHKNKLTSLKGAPHSVGGGFYCFDNQLTSLEYAPHSVGGSFYCFDNQLTSLQHAPRSVAGSFSCSKNQLISLEHAPHSVGDYFSCNDNQLTSLEHAPQKFKILFSDSGVFASCEEIPEKLRLSPATSARQEEERQISFSEGATVLNAPIKVSSPLRLKK